MSDAKHTFNMEQMTASIRDMAVLAMRYYQALIEEGAEPMVALRLTGELTRGMVQPRKEEE